MSRHSLQAPMVGLSVMPEPEYLAAALPLFESGRVDTIEWSFDMSWRHGLPDWLGGLIADYEAAGRLAGHGVSLSPLSTHPRQAAWFERFATDVQNHQFTQVSEHFGFMAAGDFYRGPPMPLPMTNETLAVGRAHLERLASLTGVPVGLENLAFAFGPGDVWTQGDFLEELLAPVDGFLVLDVHNLWCQVANFGVDPIDVLASYPVDRVRECHVSGGSWSTVSAGDGVRTIRRDTHDGEVPGAVFDLLELVLERCVHVESVILEWVGAEMADPANAESLSADFDRLRSICQADRSSKPLPNHPNHPDRQWLLDGLSFPADTMRILDRANSPDQAIAEITALATSPGDFWHQWAAQMEPAMVATAIELMVAWGRRR